MQPERIRQLIHHGESDRLELKTITTESGHGVFETICAFLNHNGGELIIGVSDRGELLGIHPDIAEDLRDVLIAAGTNPARFSPVIALEPEIVAVDGKIVLYLFVPEGSRVFRYHGRVFVRQGKSDVDISRNPRAITSLAIQKQKAFSENEVFPHLTIAELRGDLIGRVRTMAALRIENHPWSSMSDEDLLKSAGLYATDCLTGKSGYTLAAALLFGRDVVIRSIVPHYRTEALLRRVNTDRYDERDDVRTNLLDSYDRLLAFVRKHLGNPLSLEGAVQISACDILFREVVANMLIHREYANPVPSRLIIERDRVIAENGSKLRKAGSPSFETYAPYPRNPSIAGVFKEIRYSGVLGSGVRNVSIYSHIYSGTVPRFIDKDVFQVIIFLPAAVPIPDVYHPSAHDEIPVSAHDGLAQEYVGAHDERNARILRFCAVPRTRDEIQRLIGMASREYCRREVLSPLLASGELQLTLPDKPKSKLQKYVAAKKD